MRWPIYGLVVVLAGAAVISTSYLYYEKQHDRELETTNQSLSTSMTQLQNDLQAVKGQLSDLSTPRPPAPLTTPAQPPAVKARAKAPIHAKRTPPPDDPRFKEIQTQLSDQQQQLASTREDLDKTRDDLQSSVSSTKDELNGSIARTHDELVALQKRGEKNYYEFQIAKSKAFEKVGPLRLSLRKADAKHKRYDVTMLVDDNQLQKKSVNLYETVWLNLADRPQPLEVVVNQITKDHIQGYVSEPKYSKSELSQTANPN